MAVLTLAVLLRNRVLVWNDVEFFAQKFTVVGGLKAQFLISAHEFLIASE